ncbi:hypothetical protein WA158_005365 [Blastocystis sp. Blastoise]
MDADYDYVLDSVKKHSWDNYYVGCLLPEEVKVPYMVLQAFNIEVAQSIDNAHGNILSGRVRLQWWRDRVEEMVNDHFVLSNPVMKCLTDVYEHYSFNPVFLDRIIEARENEMNISQPDQCMEVEDTNLEQAIKHISHTISITTYTRGLPFHFAQHHTYLPLDLCKKNLLEEDDMYNGDNEKAKQVIKELVNISVDEYLESKKLSCDPYGKQILKYVTPSITYLKSLIRHNYNIYDDSYLGQKMRNKVQMKLLKNKMFNTY